MKEQHKVRIRKSRTTRQNGVSREPRGASIVGLTSPLFALCCCLSADGALAFSVSSKRNSAWRKPTFLSIRPPPGSGYAGPEDEVSTFPATYEPMMEYPGTMRPGRTPENMPFQDLPIADSDPDPVPWPHFQQIEWHHRWDPPHEHPIPMEDFIEMHGRWATPEMEAAMRTGVRRDVRERRQQEEEAVNKDVIITDDDEEDDDELGAAAVAEDPISLGDGVFGQLGSDADRAATAAAVDPAKQGKKEEDSVDDDAADDGLDDFLLDLGLDMDLDDDDGGVGGGESKPETKGDDTKDDGKGASFDLDFDDDDDDDESEKISLTASSGTDGTTTINVDDDDDLVVLDEDDELEGDTIPLEDFDDENDTLDTEDVFDEGGFDFDDDFGGDDFDGGDMW